MARQPPGEDPPDDVRGARVGFKAGARRPQAAWAIVWGGPASPSRYPYGGRPPRYRPCTRTWTAIAVHRRHPPVEQQPRAAPEPASHCRPLLPPATRPMMQHTATARKVPRFPLISLLGAGHVLVGQGGCGPPRPIPHCGRPTPCCPRPSASLRRARPAAMAGRSSDDSSSAFGTIGRSRTPASAGSRASRLTSVSGFHQVDSMAISEATFRHGLVGSTWPGGCVEPLSSAWPAVSLVGAGA